MTAYAIFTRVRTLDPAEMAIYSENAKNSLIGHTVRPLAVYGKQEVLEGPDTEGVVVLEFPTMEAARAWYDSPETSATRVHRLKGGEYTGVIVEGVLADPQAGNNPAHFNCYPNTSSE